jgi:hypothetical protein
MQPMTPEEVARRALDGDREALDRLVRDLQGDVYGFRVGLRDEENVRKARVGASDGAQIPSLLWVAGSVTALTIVAYVSGQPAAILHLL